MKSNANGSWARRLNNSDLASWHHKESRPVMGGGTTSGKHCELCNAGPLRFMEQYPHQGKTLCPACYKKEKS